MPFKTKDRVVYTNGEKQLKTKKNLLLEEDEEDDMKGNEKQKKSELQLKDILFEKQKEEELQIIDLNLLPKWVEETCPTDWALYNLFERYIPFSGYIGIMVATAWESMFLKDKRPISFVLVGVGAGGKTYALEQFKQMPNLEDIEYPTYSTFIKKYGDTSPESQKSRMLNNKFLYLTEMAMINRTEEQTRKNLFSCWNSLLTEGKYEGSLRGNMYYIGERLKPVKFGVIGAMVTEDYKEKVFPINDFTTRIMITFHQFVPDEVMVLNEGIMYERFGDYDISKRVYSIIPKYKHKYNVEYQPFDLNMEGVRNVAFRIAMARGESFGFRAMQDAKRFLKAHALLNRREKVIDDDVKMLNALSVSFNEKCSSNLSFQLMLQSQENDDNLKVLNNMKTFRVIEIKRKHLLYQEKSINEAYQNLLMYAYFGMNKAKQINKIIVEKESDLTEKEKKKKKMVLLDFFSDERLKKKVGLETEEIEVDE